MNLICTYIPSTPPLKILYIALTKDKNRLGCSNRDLKLSFKSIPFWLLLITPIPLGEAVWPSNARADARWTGSRSLPSFQEGTEGWQYF
jgi:hypothetical protein